MRKMNYIWQDRKRTFLGLPWSFTKYMLTEDRLFVEKGLLTSTLGQRLFGLGTVKVFSTDASNGETVLESIKNPIEVKEEIVRLVEAERKKHNIRASEMLMNAPDPHDCDHDGDGIPDIHDDEVTMG